MGNGIWYSRSYRYRTFSGEWVRVDGVGRVEAQGQYVVFRAPNNDLIKMVAWNSASVVEPIPPEDTP